MLQLATPLTRTGAHVFFSRHVHPLGLTALHLIFGDLLTSSQRKHTALQPADDEIRSRTRPARARSHIAHITSLAPHVISLPAHIARRAHCPSLSARTTHSVASWAHYCRRVVTARQSPLIIIVMLAAATARPRTHTCLSSDRFHDALAAAPRALLPSPPCAPRRRATRHGHRMVRPLARACARPASPSLSAAPHTALAAVPAEARSAAMGREGRAHAG